MTNILVIICHYGPFPWYFTYFLHSCKYNETIDFIIFSDNDHLGELPKNVHVIKKSLVELKNLASEKLDLKVRIDFPYKLCDFKPAYGLIFEDYLSGYDFWCQSDIDIIFGDIRGFLSSSVLNAYDFISMRHDYTTGCFAVYKNCRMMNHFFKRSRDYKRVFTSSQHFCFDECNFVWDELSDDVSIFDVKTEIESFTHIVRTGQIRGELRARFEFILIEGLVGKICFVDGKIIYNNKFEGILYHLFWLKRIYTPKKAPSYIPSRFRISPTRIYA